MEYSGFFSKWDKIVNSPASILKIAFSQPLGEKMQSLSAKLPTLWTDTN